MQLSMTHIVDHEHAAMKVDPVPLIRDLHPSISVYLFGGRAGLSQAVLAMVSRWDHGRRTS
jgi:hypothetical protein